MTGNESTPTHLRLIDSRRDQAQAPERSAEIDSLEQLSAPASIARPLSAARDAWAGRQTVSTEAEIGEQVLSAFVFKGVQRDASAMALGTSQAREVLVPKSVWASTMFEGLRASAIGKVEEGAEAAGVKIGRATEQMRAAA